MKRIVSLFAVFLIVGTCHYNETQAVCVHPQIGTTVSSGDGSIKLTLKGKHQNFQGGADHCGEINSPKSVHVAPDGKKYYVNSLEGGKTLVFDGGTDTLIKVVSHFIDSSHDALWGADAPELYPFTHYKKSNHFQGKPVESTFSHDGRYLWVPYYRRSYDVNAQDPSAVAVIDTRKDEIVRLMETGPLPKMIATSPDGRYIAVSHWGNNTVGLIDIRSDNPMEWKHEKLLVVDYVLPLNYPLSKSVDRDSGSGYALRGTVFTPDSRYLLVGCMGGGGGIAVIDVESGEYLGRITGMMSNLRHLIIHDDWLYLSINSQGYVQRCKLQDFIAAIKNIDSQTKRGVFSNWENAKVAPGARTISISPSGKFIFAACNTGSELCIVDTRTMKMIAFIPADSYPVGLDISCDGTKIYTTSQGKKHVGGNCVDIYEVEYSDPEPVGNKFTAPAYSRLNAPSKKTIEENKVSANTADNAEATVNWTLVWGIIIGLSLIFVVVAIIVFRNIHTRRNKIEK